MAELLESCCWNDLRDYCKGRGCECGCHESSTLEEHRVVERYEVHHYAYSADLFDRQSSASRLPRATIYDHQLAETIVRLLNNQHEERP